MGDSPRLELPLLQAAQAQKHVTVNEALVRLDGLVQLTLASTSTLTPPGLPSDGDCYAVPVGAVNAWATHVGEIAIYSNGGWVFANPMDGWSAWVQDANDFVRFHGGEWIGGISAISANGAAFIHSVIEIDHSVLAGPTSVVSGAIPASAIVYGITGRVSAAFGGAATGWQLGVPGAPNRYGSGIGVGLGSWLRGMTASPLTYYAPTDLVLTSEGSDFVDGDVRLAIHFAQLGLPTV